MSEVSATISDTIKKEKTNRSWTFALFEETVQEIIEQFGCIPPQPFLDSRGYSGFKYATAKFGPTILAVRKQFNVHNVRLTSVDGQSWLSIAETNTANMLLIRGFEVSKGRRYPEEYSKKYPRDHADYDMHFTASDAEHAGKEIDVEVWGGPKGGAGKHRYAETRSFKLDFHKDRTNFLGIEWAECYSDAKLLAKLHPYIGDAVVIPKYAETLPPVAIVAMPVYEQVLQECKEILGKLDTDVLPAEAWFCRIKNYKDRQVYDWEPPSWYSFKHRLALVKISVVRKALGNRCPTTWTKEKVVDEMVKWYQSYDISPSNMDKRITKMTAPDSKDIEVKRHAQSLSGAARRHWKMTELMEIVKEKLVTSPPSQPIVSTRLCQDWTADLVVATMGQWQLRHDVTPAAMLSRLSKLPTPNDAEVALKREASTLYAAMRKHFGKDLPRFRQLVDAHLAEQSA